jgi:hypothetical protein
MAEKSFFNAIRERQRASILLAALDLVFCVSIRPAQAAISEPLSDYTAAGVTSEYGTVSVVRFSTGVVELKPKALVQSAPGTMRQLSFSENVWVIGYYTSIQDEQGRSPTENYICHTLFCDQRAAQRQDQRMRALYSDGFTRGFQLPKGYAVPFSQLDTVHFMPMFNNRTDRVRRVRMDIEVQVIREKDLRKPLQPLYSTLRSVNVPHLYFVPPARHERQITFEMPFDGRIHFIGSHLHPHAESITVSDVSRGRQVWRGKLSPETPATPSNMETYSSAEGYPVHRGDVFRLSSVYNNPTSNKIDAMSAVFLYYSEN